MASLFSRIISGEIPAHTIAEDERFFAFLDVFPLAEGHVLVVPKSEVDSIFDLSPEVYSGLFAFTQPIAKAIKQAFPCTKVGMAVIGLEVPHAHIHLVPINEANDLNFSKPKLKVTPEMLQEAQRKIVEAFNS